MKMEFEGVITMIGQEETVGANNLRKVTFVVEEESDREFKGSIAVDMFGDRVDQLKDYNTGDKVRVSLNSRAREYNGRRFNSISAWRIEKTSGASNTSGNATDDLPF